MANGNDKNYVSVGFWMLALFVMAIPCVGWAMILVWAFWGENESRKNYFRALIIWTLIWLIVFLVLVCLGMLPVLIHEIHQVVNRGH